MTIDSKSSPPLPPPADTPLELDEPNPQARTTPLRVLRMAQVIELTGLKKATIYKLHQKGEFPRNVKLSTRAVGWIDDDVHRWIADRRSRPS